MEESLFSTRITCTNSSDDLSRYSLSASSMLNARREQILLASFSLSMILNFMLWLDAACFLLCRLAWHVLLSFCFSSSIMWSFLSGV